MENIKESFKSFLLSAVIPNTPSYINYYNSNNIDVRLSELEMKYLESFGLKLFEIDLSNRAEYIKIIVDNLKNKAGTAFVEYSNSVGSGVPAAIVNTHFTKFLTFYQIPVSFDRFQDLIDKVHIELGNNFILDFQRQRIKYNGNDRIGRSSILFGLVRDDYWTINVGSEKEIQYHMFFEEDYVGYGLAFNAQKSMNNLNPVHAVKPFIDSYFKNKNQISGHIIDYTGINQDENKLLTMSEGEFVCLGKTIGVTMNSENIYTIPGEAFLNLIYDLKNKQFEAYKLIFEGRNKLINMKNSLNYYIDILRTNKNLILNGAPGTGKTYLAKDIASAMDAEFTLVQFHPSYDYTDFVEGLRPIKKDDQELGFELRDGTFKAFCKKALKNLLDSRKSKEELQRQETLEESLSLFIDKIEYEISTNGKFPLFGIGGKECASIIAIDVDSFTVLTYNNNKLSTNIRSILSKYEIFLNHPTKWTFKDVKQKLASYHHTYYYAFLNAFDEFNKKGNISISEVKPVVKKDFVFIIDEINRGEISKIFGELFSLIECDYRNENSKTHTQYSNLIEDDDIYKNGFYIPENVYIIGTMNDIDRSVESFDFAMRRRFTWIEIKAEDRLEMLDNLENAIKLEAISKMRAINKLIGGDYEKDILGEIDGLNSSYNIGPAYFLKLKYCNFEFTKLWDYHIEPLIKEYLRGLPNANSDLLKIRKAYFPEI